MKRDSQRANLDKTEFASHPERLLNLAGLRVGGFMSRLMKAGLIVGGTGVAAMISGMAGGMGMCGAPSTVPGAIAFFAGMLLLVPAGVVICAAAFVAQERKPPG